jgi:5'-3' exonuclease
MGIKNLPKFLRTKIPGVFEHIHLSEYKFKVVAIDTSLYLCNFKAFYGEGEWLAAFVRLVACLRENDVHCVFIYDNGAPPEKLEEKKKRAEARSKLDNKVAELKKAIDLYQDTNELTDILKPFGKSNSLLDEGEEKSFDVSEAIAHVAKLEKQLFTVTKDDFEATKTLLSILKVPFFTAALEAETTCADLCLQGKVDAVLSSDTDVLAYGAPVFLTNLDIRRGTCFRIRYENVLKELKMTSDQFLDFCIMCGTDYNKNIFKIGPEKSLKLIQTYKSIESIRDDGKIDVTILNHVRVRQLFREYQRSSDIVTYCGIPDFSKLHQFLFTKNVRMHINVLEKSFKNQSIVIIDDEEEEEQHVEHKRA